MPIDYQHPTSDIAVNLMHSVVQQCQYNHAFPACLELLDSSLTKITDIVLVASDDDSIKNAMVLIRLHRNAFAVKIIPGPDAKVHVRSWMKFVSAYAKPDDRAGVNTWDRSKGYDPNRLAS